MSVRTRIAVILLAAVAASAETLVLRNFTLIDGTGRAPVPNAALVIVDGRIRYAGPVSVMKAPAGAQSLDLKGKYIMPGIINLHGHLANVKGLIQDPKNYTPENLEREPENLRQLRRNDDDQHGQRSGSAAAAAHRAAGRRSVPERLASTPRIAASPEKVDIRLPRLE